MIIIKVIIISWMINAKELDDKRDVKNNKGIMSAMKVKIMIVIIVILIVAVVEILVKIVIIINSNNNTR